MKLTINSSTGRLVYINYFSYPIRGKILIPLWLRGGGMPGGGQNIDSTRLVAKILRNKGLETPIASGSGNAKLVPDCFGSVRTIPIVRASTSSVKVVRHKIAVFFCGWLWKSEEA
jgi:hypothetical protein